MAKERGWWDLNLYDQRMDDLSDVDRDHIAGLIQKGCTGGELVEDEEDARRKHRKKPRRSAAERRRLWPIHRN